MNQTGRGGGKPHACSDWMKGIRQVCHALWLGCGRSGAVGCSQTWTFWSLWPTVTSCTVHRVSYNRAACYRLWVFSISSCSQWMAYNTQGRCGRCTLITLDCNVWSMCEAPPQTPLEQSPNNADVRCKMVARQHAVHLPFLLCHMLLCDWKLCSLINIKLSLVFFGQ